MQKDRLNFTKGFVDKYGGTSVIVKEQDKGIVDRTASKFSNVPDDGYSFVVVSGQGKIDDTKDGDKLTNHMYDIVNGTRPEHAWSVVKRRIQEKYAAHQISEEHYKDDLSKIERILASGDTISDEDAPLIIGFPELQQAKLLCMVGNQMHPDKSWVLLSWLNSNLPLGLVGTQGHGYINVPIDHSTSLTNIFELATKANLKGKIGIIPGFVGSYSLDRRDQLVTLERGSSDATATYWAAALDLDEVVIYSDKPGIMPIDPAIIKDDKELKEKLMALPELTYLEAHLFAGWGAGIIQQLAIRPVMDKRIPLIIKSSLEPDLPGTLIGGHATIQNYGVRAIAYVPNRSAIIVKDISDKPGSGAYVGSLFGEKNISIEHLVDGVNQRAHMVDSSNPNIGPLISQLGTNNHRYTIEGPYARIALVGAGMDHAHELSGNVHATEILTNTLNQLGINGHYRTFFKGDISHSVFVEQQYAKTVVKSLARNLGMINGN